MCTLLPSEFPILFPAGFGDTRLYSDVGYGKKSEPLSEEEDAGQKVVTDQDLQKIKSSHARDLEELKAKLQRETEDSKLELLEEKDEQIKDYKVYTILIFKLVISICDCIWCCIWLTAYK